MSAERKQARDSSYGIRAPDELSAVAGLRLVLTTEIGGRLYALGPPPGR